MTHRVSADYLAEITRDAFQRTTEMVRGLDMQQLIGPENKLVNPLLWEIGHVAWFHEQFILRQIDRREPMLPNGDRLYDSISIHHADRRVLPLLPLDEIQRYRERVLQEMLGRVKGPIASEEDSYIHQFTVLHEDMHAENFTFMRQTLRYPAPPLSGAEEKRAKDGEAGPLPGDVSVPGGEFMLGARPDDAFVFDNEMWAHPQKVYPFKIARTPVTNAEYAEFIADGGYKNPLLWHDVAWGWREKGMPDHPVYWVPDGEGGWGVRHFDGIEDLAPHQPVIHVSWYEASAYCKWAGRRLPTELEWEVAAAAESNADGSALSSSRRSYPWGEAPPDATRANLDGWAQGCVDVAALPESDSAFGCRQMIGNVWEWTASSFEPYPGFTPGVYKEYSEPMFGTRRVLRGGAWPTRGRVVNNRYRNFFQPERRDTFAGFRTCAMPDWYKG